MKLLKAAALFALLFAMGVGASLRDARATSPAGAVDRATGIATCNSLIPTNGVGGITATAVRQCTTLIWNSMLASLSNLADCGSPSACLLSLGGTAGPASSVAGHIVTFADATGKVLQDGGLPNSGVAGPGSAVVGHAVTWGNSGATSLLDSGTGLRKILTSSTTFYTNASGSLTAACGGFVCNPGSDSNNCLTNLTPCQTIQHTVSAIADAYDFASAVITFQLADGTYNEHILLPEYVTSTNQGRAVTIAGHAGNTSLVTLAGGAFNTITSINAPHGWILKDLHITSSATCIFNDYNSKLYWDGGDFGACTNYQVQAVNGGSFFEFTPNNYTISGGSQYHAQAQNGAEIICNSVTATITGSPTFSFALFGAAGGALVDDSACTISGAFTGDKFDISSPGASFMLSSGVAITPGSTQYIGQGSISSTETNYVVLPSSYHKLVDMYVSSSAPPGAGKNININFRIAGGATSMTCTISNAATACHDKIHTVTSGGVAGAGAVIDVQVVSDAGAGAGVISVGVVGD